MRSGETNATQANATAKIAGTIVDTVNMEMAALKLMQRSPKTEVSNNLARLPSIPLSGI